MTVFVYVCADANLPSNPVPVDTSLGRWYDFHVPSVQQRVDPEAFHCHEKRHPTAKRVLTPCLPHSDGRKGHPRHQTVL